MDKIIQIENLCKNFIGRKDDTVALKNVSFYVGKGETLGIVGESGSGKSTIAKLLTGLITSTSGEIRICDNDLKSYCKKKPLEFYEKIQVVFQNPVASFNPRKTIGYGIAEPLKNRGMSKKGTKARVIELLESCGLGPEFADKYPYEISGGQCQRAAIARALAVEPEILICDEATSALDVTVQKQIIELLDELRKQRKLTIIFICHNLALVQKFCDRVIVLYNGEIVEEGLPDDIIREPKDDYTKLLIDSIV